MANQSSTNMIVVTQATQTPNQQPNRVALFKEDGTAFVPLTTAAAAQADFVGADLAALKVELNGFLAKLRTAGILLP